LIRIRESITFSESRDFATDFWRTLYAHRRLPPPLAVGRMNEPCGDGTANTEANSNPVLIPNGEITKRGYVVIVTLTINRNREQIEVVEGAQRDTSAH
jgi:hypothetical protein